MFNDPFTKAMKHIILPVMQLDVFPEDTSFMVFEEDWCLNELHAKIRQIRCSWLWQPFLEGDDNHLVVLETLEEQYDKEEKRAAKKHYDPEHFHPVLEIAALTARHHAERARMEAEGHDKAAIDLAFPLDQTLPNGVIVDGGYADAPKLRDESDEEMHARRGNIPKNAITDLPDEEPSQPSHQVDDFCGSDGEPESDGKEVAWQNPRCRDVYNNILEPPKLPKLEDTKEWSPFKEEVLQLCALHTKAARNQCGNIVIAGIVHGRGETGPKEGKKPAKDKRWDSMRSGWKEDYPAWGTMLVMYSKAGARVLHSFMRETKTLHYGHFDRTLQAFLERPAKMEDKKRIQRNLLPPQQRQGHKCTEKKTWFGHDSQSVSDNMGLNIGACWVWPSIGHFCVHTSSCDAFVSHERPGHWRHKSVAENFSGFFKLGAFATREMSMMSPHGQKFFYNLRFDQSQFDTRENPRFVDEWNNKQPWFKLETSGILWETECPNWITTEAMLTKALKEPGYWGLRVHQGSKNFWYGPTDGLTDTDKEALKAMWEGSANTGSARARKKLADLFWKHRYLVKRSLDKAALSYVFC